MSKKWIFLLVMALFLAFQGCSGGSEPVECHVDQDCAGTQACIDNECVGGTGCRLDADCGAYEVCRNGSCENARQACVTDDDCPNQEVCRDGDCIAGRECQSDAQCGEGATCFEGACVSPGVEFTLRVTDSPVQDGEASFVVEDLDFSISPATIELYIDGALLSTFKQMPHSFNVTTLGLTDGDHQIWLKLSLDDGQIYSGRTTFYVGNPSVIVTGTESPDYVYPDGLVEIWLEIDGALDDIEADFSAIDAGFSQSDVALSMDGGRYRISYTIPQRPSGAEGSYSIPITIIASDETTYTFDSISFFMGSGPLLPFRSDDAMVDYKSLPSESDGGASLFVESMSIEEASVITGSTVEIEVTFSGKVAGGRLLIGNFAWGGFLLIPVSSLEHIADSTYLLELELPLGSVEGTQQFRFLGVAMDSDGLVGVAHSLRADTASVTAVDVPQGALQITLSWDKGSRPDLDLHLVEPNDVEVYWSSKSSPQSQASLDLDANAMCPDEGDVVNKEVYNAFTPIEGDYQVKIAYYDDCDHAGAVNYKLKIVGCGVSETLNLSTTANPTGGGAGAGVLVKTISCQKHYFVEGSAKYRYWKLKGATPEHGDLRALRGVPIKLVDHTGTEIALDYLPRTDEQGNYKVAFMLDDARAGWEVGLAFYTKDDEVEVYELKHNASDAAPDCCTGDADKVHEARHPVEWIPEDEPNKTLPSYQILLHDSAGFHVFQVMKKASKYYKTLLKDWNTSIGDKIVVETLKGKNPRCDEKTTSCYSRTENRFYLLGNYAKDQDYYDDAIMLHELGHMAIRNAALVHSPGDQHDIKKRLVPGHAWSEGLSTYLAQSIIEANKAGEGQKSWCDRTGLNDNCMDVLDTSEFIQGVFPNDSGGTLSEGLVTAVLWTLRDGKSEDNHDAVNVPESAFLQYYFDKSADNVANTMQTPANLDKGVAGDADMADLIHLWGCPHTEDTTPKLSEIKTLLKDKWTLDWLAEAGFCP